METIFIITVTALAMFVVCFYEHCKHEDLTPDEYENQQLDRAW
jgi:hypothetical protein